MPLPADEERQLQEIGQALCRDDPKSGRRMRGAGPQAHHKRTLIGAQLGVVTGAGLLPGGAVTRRACLQAAGVVIVVLSLPWAVISWRRYAARARPARPGAGTTTATGAGHRPGQASRAQMMKRMEQRWRHRQQGNGEMPGRTRS